MAKDVGAVLETTFDGRLLTLVVLKGAVQVSGSGGSRQENGYFLAARRPNGTLTAGLWPDDHRSSLVNETIRAFRRDTGLDK